MSLLAPAPAPLTATPPPEPKPTASEAATDSALMVVPDSRRTPLTFWMTYVPVAAVTVHSSSPVLAIFAAGVSQTPRPASRSDLAIVGDGGPCWAAKKSAPVTPLRTIVI